MLDVRNTMSAMQRHERRWLNKFFIDLRVKCKLGNDQTLKKDECLSDRMVRLMELPTSPRTERIEDIIPHIIHLK